MVIVSVVSVVIHDRTRYSTIMKKLFVLLLALIMGTAAFAETSNQYVFGFGESIYKYDVTGGDNRISNGMFTIEEWSLMYNFLGSWVHFSTGKTDTISFYPEGTSLHSDIPLNKCRLIDVSCGVGLNIPVGIFSVVAGAGPHLGVQSMKFSEQDARLNLLGGIGGTVGVRLNFGGFFITTEFPFSYDLFQLNDNGIDGYHGFGYKSFFGIGFRD